MTRQQKQTDTVSNSVRATNSVSLRIHTLGTFRVEWVDPQTGQVQPLPPERLQKRGAAPALGLLQALLSRPNRFATRDWLLEQFWPDSSARSASDRLDDVASALRGLLRPEGCQDKILHFVYGADGRGNGYRLEGYPSLWCDADALAWHVEQAARMQRYGDDPLPYWQRAYDLASCGVYLAEEIYSDWPKARRAEASGHLRQAVHALARLYLERSGKAGEEEALLVLRRYWESSPTDEDALRQLMELLGKHERFQEALAYYERLHTLLEEDGQEPTAQTQDLAEYMRTKQVQRTPQQSSVETSVKTSAQSIVQKMRNLSLSGTQESFLSPSMARPLASAPFLLPFCMIQPEKTLETTFPDCAAQLGRALAHMVTLIQQWYGMAMFSQDLQQLLDQEMKNLDAFKLSSPLEIYTLSRRSILFALATLPTSLLLSRKQAHKLVLQLEEFLPHCAASITACWHLSKGSHLETIPSIIDSYLPTLIAVLKNAPSHYEVAADLIAQCYLLKSILAWHLENLAAAENYCIQATHYSGVAKNRNLQLTALNQHALIFYYAKQFQRALATSEEAYETLQLSSREHIFSIIQGRVLMYLAAFQAQQNMDGAEQTLELAQNAFAVHAATVEPIPTYIDCGEASLTLWNGLTHYHLGLHDMAHARHALTSLKVYGHLQSSTDIPERFRLECLTNRTLAAIQAHEMEEAIDCFVAGKQGAYLLESKQRQAEIAYANQELVARWPREKQVQQLQKSRDTSF